MTSPLGLGPDDLAALRDAMAEVACPNEKCDEYPQGEAVYGGRSDGSSYVFLRCEFCLTPLNGNDE